MPSHKRKVQRKIKKTMKRNVDKAKQKQDKQDKPLPNQEMLLKLMALMGYGILCSLLCSTGLFSPQALAMACGTGSASMMSASLGAVVEAYPTMAEELQALAASSQLLSSVDGLYMTLFIALPMTEWMYKMFTKNNKNYKDGQPIKKNA